MVASQLNCTAVAPSDLDGPLPSVPQQSVQVEERKAELPQSRRPVSAKEGASGDPMGSRGAAGSGVGAVQPWTGEECVSWSVSRSAGGK